MNLQKCKVVTVPVKGGNLLRVYPFARQHSLQAKLSHSSQALLFAVQVYCQVYCSKLSMKVPHMARPFLSCTRL